jgi:uncharacterized protein YggE
MPYISFAPIITAQQIHSNFVLMKYLIHLALLCLNTSLFAQASGNLNYNQAAALQNTARAEIRNEEIALSVTGLLNARADTFVAFFHVMQVGETAASTDSLMMARINKFKETLNKVMPGGTISLSTDMISFVPKYDINVINRLFSKTYNEVPDGFELQKNVIVRYHKASDMDAIITAAASAEIYDLVKVDYFLKDVKKQYDELRAQCLALLKTRIKSYEAVGIRLDTLRKTFADDFGTVLPQTRYGNYQAVARPSLKAVKKSESGFSKFHSADLSPSKYYQAEPYTEYDVVINPVVDEPMVQLSYQISMKFSLPPVEPADKKNELIFITPNGQLQKLDVRSMFHN